MLLVLIAVAFAAAWIFIDYQYDEQSTFDYDSWLRRKHDPDWSREIEAEQELQEVLSNAEEHWKDYL